MTKLRKILNLLVGLVVMVGSIASLQAKQSYRYQPYVVPADDSLFGSADNDAAAVIVGGAALLMATYSTLSNRYSVIYPIESDLFDASAGPIKHLWNWREKTLPTAADIWEHREVISRDLLLAIKHNDIEGLRGSDAQKVDAASVINACNQEIELLRGYATQLEGLIGIFFGYTDIYASACANAHVTHDRDIGALNRLTRAQAQAIDAAMQNEYVSWLNPHGYVHWNYNYAVQVRWQVEKYLRRLYALRNVFERPQGLQTGVMQQVRPALYQLQPAQQ